MYGEQEMQQPQDNGQNNNDNGEGAQANNENMAGQQPADPLSAHMSEQVNEDGYVMIPNQGVVNQGNSGNPGGALAKPEFGPSASKLLAPLISGIQRTANTTDAQTPQNFDTHVVLMKGITWSRDSHGLFDYESRHLTKKTLKASYESMIMRSGNDLSLNRYNSMRSFQEQCDAKKQMPEDMAMLKIVNRSNTFYLESATYQPHHVDIERNEQNGKSQESMYLVVRSLKVNNEKIDYEIQEKDILKIGRVKFAVKEIGKASTQMEVDEQPPKEEKGHSANSIFTDTNEEDFEEFTQVPATMQDLSHEDPERKCRFCWASEASQENPLLGTCKCAGSVGQIHYSCLSNWLETRKQSKVSSNFKTFFWKAFECEICKTPYPLQMKSQASGTNGTTGGLISTYNLVKYEKPQGDFMVLESLSQEKNNSRIIHIISPSPGKTVFKLGRGHESDLRINDISVSRCHTKIKFERGKFLLEDNQSKFGTLVLVKQRTPLLPGFNKAVQIGRTVINFSVKHLQKPDGSTATGVEAATNDVIDNMPNLGAMGVVRANGRPAASQAAATTEGADAQNQPEPSSQSQPRRMVRRGSEREMPSAEEQFAAQMGTNSANNNASANNGASSSNQQQPVIVPPQTSQSDFVAEYAAAQIASYPEDVQLQMALQASMQTANLGGQVQGNSGDQDSVNQGVNDNDN